MISVSAQNNFTENFERNLTRHRSKFYNSKQFPGECISDWFSRLKFLSASCHFGKNCDLILLQNFIAGIYSEEIFDELCARNSNLTLSKALQIATNLETTIFPAHKKLKVWSSFFIFIIKNSIHIHYSLKKTKLKKTVKFEFLNWKNKIKWIKKNN